MKKIWKQEQTEPAGGSEVAGFTKTSWRFW